MYLMVIHHRWMQMSTDNTVIYLLSLARSYLGTDLLWEKAALGLGRKRQCVLGWLPELRGAEQTFSSLCEPCSVFVIPWSPEPLQYRPCQQMFPSNPFVTSVAQWLWEQQEEWRFLLVGGHWFTALLQSTGNLAKAMAMCVECEF